ncbi:MAG: ParB/RepB/Spo0J family partition protein [Clostridium tyrobutyricum]|jgi:ParB family chromosome partitioning protein|uniref:ParB/RepB/Spo0J family partition protein n=1 Tax=Clostridium tyrobutyricum TaxID=1519 RepID=UPI0024302CD8|nr:ParB/RepB/Spo0J family partition protein [Clostridium tyrobutyricum]MCH4200164.1 ParB/RepB/Spo0J family partition protein [Clostridium tyrobutyricum]MCH4259732.1 ParB/RepB/Spo0J family partition protein [Clostridium tyrobutyricum]
MAKSKFKLNNNFAKNIADAVNNVEVKSSFNIRNIDINLLVPSEKNFYRIEDIEKLAEDIELNGLYHNLIVRKLKDEEKYEILSGERRYKALKMLYEGGNDKFSKVPCKLGEWDDTDAEIVLIQSNAEVRQLSDIEKIKQIERLEVLYKLKKNRGEKIPGKLRDKIGEDMGMSGIQVQRYKKIGKDLIPELKEMLETKRIGMADAASFAGLPEKEQKVVYEFLKTDRTLSASEANKMIKDKNNTGNEVLKQKVTELNKPNSDIKKNIDENKEESHNSDEKNIEVNNEKTESNSNNLEKIESINSIDNNSININKETSSEDLNIPHNETEKILDIIDETSSNLNNIKNQFQQINYDDTISSSLNKLKNDIDIFLVTYKEYLSKIK